MTERLVVITDCSPSDQSRPRPAAMEALERIVSTDDGVGWRRWGGSAEGATALDLFCMSRVEILSLPR